MIASSVGRSVNLTDVCTTRSAPRAGELREVLARDIHLDGPRDFSGSRYCLITSMPMVWSVVFCVEKGFFGAMRRLCCCVSRYGRCTPYSRAPPV